MTEAASPGTPRPGFHATCDAIVTALQLDLLRVLWAHGACTVDFVRSAIAGQHPLARATVHTLLARLARRGLVELVVVGRSHRYAARVTEVEVRQAMVEALVDSVFNRRAADVVAHVLADPGLGRAELASLRVLLEGAAVR